MSRFGVVREIFDLIAHRKKYWMIPVVIFLLLLGLIVVLTANSALAPFIYTVF